MIIIAIDVAAIDVGAIKVRRVDTMTAITSTRARHVEPGDGDAGDGAINAAGRIGNGQDGGAILVGLRRASIGQFERAGSDG